MSKNSEILKQIAVSPSEEVLRSAKRRREGRFWLKKSRQIALSVHYYLEEKDMTQKELAERMGVSPSYIARLLKGQENLSLETISKIEVSLGVQLIYVDRPYVDNSKRVTIGGNLAAGYGYAVTPNINNVYSNNHYTRLYGVYQNNVA